MKIKDMIQWVPTSLGYWSPRNVRNVESYGLESKVGSAQVFERTFFKNKHGIQLYEICRS
jgi:iron complex outermembrane receptor protein